MTSLIAHIKREYLEHRGAFLYAPGLILVILTAIMLSGVTVGRFSAMQKVEVLSADKVFEVGFLVVGALWMVYLLAALFFYFADAFSADSRNNAMLFWKSMPQSDFRILASKMLSGLTIFPALIFVALLLSGVIVLVGVSIIQVTVPVLSATNPLGLVTSALNIVVFDFVYLVVAMLWYAPFFAWVGLLSTLFRRWSIPLAFLIPALLGLAEYILLRNSMDGPGYVLGYLKQRINLPVDRVDLTLALFGTKPFDATYVLSRFLMEVDWAQLTGGIAVAAVLVYLASEYRRRVLAS